MLSEEDEHNHEEFIVVTNMNCIECGESVEVCAMCGKDLHKCKVVKDKRLPPGYRVVKDFPDYMVNNQASVRHIPSLRYCMLVRVSKTGGAMINLRKDGKTYTKAAQEIRDAAFNVSGD
jgi:hypothetical protein